MEEVGNIKALITIVFGLMLTDLFASIHRLIRQRQLVRWHWLTVLLAWYVLLLILKNWYGLVISEDDVAWAGGWIFLFYGHLFLLLYLLASAVLPDEIPSEGVDLRIYYLSTAGHLWTVMACINGLLLAFTVLRPLLSDASLNMGAVVSNTIMGSIVVSLILIRAYRYHVVVILILASLLLLELAFRF